MVNTRIQWYWSHIYLPKSIWAGRASMPWPYGCKTSAYPFWLYDDGNRNMFSCETTWEKTNDTRTNFTLLNTNFVWLHTNLCDNQSHKYFVWFFVRFPWIAHKHSTNRTNLLWMAHKCLCDLGPHKACVVSSTQNHTRILRVFWILENINQYHHSIEKHKYLSLIFEVYNVFT
jgi:hypothetical protein